MNATLTVPSITGVDVELHVAGPGSRSFAFIVDWHIRVLGALAWIVVGIVSGLDPNGSLLYAAVLPAAAIYFFYHPVLEVLMAGRTPGKRMAGVRVSRLDGSVPGTGALLIRNVFRLIDSLPTFYCVGLGATMLTKHNVRLGDLAAGTVLVYDEPVKGGFAALSARAVERLGLQQAEAARDLLGRWKELDPGVRRALARRVLSGSGAEPEADDDDTLRTALEAALR